MFGEGADVVLTDAGRFHVTLHSQGAGVGFQRGTFDGAFVVRGWQGELVFVRHLKEEKTGTRVRGGFALRFGKVNAFHALRLQRYKESVVAEKYRRGGVTVSHTRSLGAVLGSPSRCFWKSDTLRFHTPPCKWSVTCRRSISQIGFTAGPLGSMAWRA